MGRMIMKYLGQPLCKVEGAANVQLGNKESTPSWDQMQLRMSIYLDMQVTLKYIQINYTCGQYFIYQYVNYLHEFNKYTCIF